MKLTCTVVIATHDRKDDLRRTLLALEALRPQPCEVIVCADGCGDGTPEFVRTNHPGCRLIVNETARGSIASRDRMIRESSGDVVLSLDDDSHPLEADFFEVVSELFSRNPRLAVATFAQRSDEFPESLDAVDFGPAAFTGSYTSSGAAIRREAFVELGGYPVHFGHAYEEPDFGLRAVNAGWQVKFETALTVRHHYTKARRNELRTHQFHARNELWSVAMRCPAPQLFAVAVFRALRQFGYAWKRGWGWVLREPLWWAAFLTGLPRCLAERRPLPWRRYRAWMDLLRRPIISEEEWLRKFGSTPHPGRDR